MVDVPACAGRSGVEVAIMISGVLVATSGSSTTGGVVVAIGIISGVVVEVAGGTESLAGIISATVPVFCVCPHAPSEVLIAPPSIYIHVGADVWRS